MAEKVGRREIYRPVPPPSFKEQGMGQVMGECIAFCVRDPEFDSQM